MSIQSGCQSKTLMMFALFDPTGRRFVLLVVLALSKTSSNLFGCYVVLHAVTTNITWMKRLGRPFQVCLTTDDAALIHFGLQRDAIHYSYPLLLLFNFLCAFDIDSG